jgi:uncharacterized protein YndB with AHSA1/START domain
MSKKSKVSSVKKNKVKGDKVLKSIKKKSVTKLKTGNVKLKTLVKPLVKKKKVVKKDVKPNKIKLVTKSKSKKIAPAKKIAPVKKVVLKKIKAKVNPIGSLKNNVADITAAIKLKKNTPKVVAKKIKKVIVPLVSKKIEKQISNVAKKETTLLKTVEKTKNKPVKETIITDEVLAINNTIPIKKENEISLSKIASIASSITNPIKKTESYSVKLETEPNGKFELEFVVRASADMLYEFLYTQSGLSEWFCDDVNIRNGIYTFIWDGQMQQARLLKTIDHQLVRYQWVDKIDGSYFEFRLQRDDLTNDVSLIVTDFADTSTEKESSILLWQNQIEKLLHVIGSIY